MHEEDRNRELRRSAAAAVILLAACGAGYRLLAQFYERSSESVRIPAGTLATLPFNIGAWTGVDQPLDERIIRATDTDDHVNRTYRRASGETVALFVGYGVNLRDLAPHRPEVCYPGAGWTLETTERVEDMPLAKGNLLSCRIHRFHRGGLGAERVVVLNYYIVDGQFCSDVSLLRSRAWRPGGPATYAAQVQIVCQETAIPGQANQLVRGFAADSAPAIKGLLVSAVAAAIAQDEAAAG